MTSIPTPPGPFAETMPSESTTGRTVYLNGEYVPEADAKVSIFDRGFLMADAVYEVTSVLDGKLIDIASIRQAQGIVAKADQIAGR